MFIQIKIMDERGKFTKLCKNVQHKCLCNNTYFNGLIIITIII